MDTGKKINELRIKKGMTLEELGDKVRCGKKHREKMGKRNYR